MYQRCILGCRIISSTVAALKVIYKEITKYCNLDDKKKRLMWNEADGKRDIILRDGKMRRGGRRVYPAAMAVNGAAVRS